MWDSELLLPYSCKYCGKTQWENPQNGRRKFAAADDRTVRARRAMHGRRVFALPMLMAGERVAPLFGRLVLLR